MSEYERRPLPARYAAVATPDLDTWDVIAEGVAAVMATLPEWETLRSGQQRLLADAMRAVSDELLKVAQQTWLGELRQMHQRMDG